MATYKPYSREYKINALKFVSTRIETCKKAIRTYLAYSKTSTDKEVKSQAFCAAMRERNLLRFLSSFREANTAGDKK